MAPFNISGDSVNIHKILDEFKETGDNKHLRMKDGSNQLYVHDSSKRHSIHFIDRIKKKYRAYKAIKNHLRDSYGEESVKILENICRFKTVSVKDLKKLEQRLTAEIGILKSGERIDNITEDHINKKNIQ